MSKEGLEEEWIGVELEEEREEEIGALLEEEAEVLLEVEELEDALLEETLLEEEVFSEEVAELVEKEELATTSEETVMTESELKEMLSLERRLEKDEETDEEEGFFPSKKSGRESWMDLTLQEAIVSVKSDKAAKRDRRFEFGMARL